MIRTGWVSRLPFNCLNVSGLAAGLLACGPAVLPQVQAQGLTERLAPLLARAEQGDATAQRRLGDAYAGAQDRTNAVIWYRKAAEQEEPRAQWQLGRFCEFGSSPMALDPQAALTWYQKAAAHGDANAQCDLGQIYETGTIAPVDHVEAYKWYTLSARNHSRVAATSRERLAHKMDTQDVQKAERLADDFVSTACPRKVATVTASIPQCSPDGPAEPDILPFAELGFSQDVPPESPTASAVPDRESVIKPELSLPTNDPVEVLLAKFRALDHPDACKPPEPLQTPCQPAVCQEPAVAPHQDAAPSRTCENPALSLDAATSNPKGGESRDLAKAKPAQEVHQKPAPISVTPSPSNVAAAAPVEPSPPNTSLIKQAEMIILAAAASLVSPKAPPTAAVAQPAIPTAPPPRAAASAPVPASTVKSNLPTVLNGPAPSTAGVAKSKGPGVPGLKSSPQGGQPVVDPELAAKLHLKGISAFGPRRAVSINGCSLFKGEETALNVDGKVVQIRCAEVKASSAIIEVAGLGSLELKLVR